MTKIYTILLALLLQFIISFQLQAQSVSSTVIDAETKQVIPYASIRLASNKGVISNEEGKFTLVLDNAVATDSIFISSMGFESLSTTIASMTDTLFLQPKAIELNDVIVSNKTYEADELIDLIKENLEKNYTTELTKKRLFFRTSEFQNMTRTDVDFKKSTIEALNEAFLDSVMETVPKRTEYYTEVLCDLYGNYTEEDQKIDIIKASTLYDKSKELDFESLEKRFNDILAKNVKKDSYLKIKSGLFGTKVTSDEFMPNEEKVDSTDTAAVEKLVEEEKKRKLEQKQNFGKYRKQRLSRFFTHFFFNEDSELNFISKSRKYDFTIADFTYFGDDPVYIVHFEPKGSADYRGTLYVQADDFAVVRLDYENVKSLKTFKLLGLSFNRYQDKGKLFFTKKGTQSYQLSYAEQTEASLFGIKRPLKIIEKNKVVKGRNKQNELFVKLDFQIQNSLKNEVVNFETTPISKALFEGYKENNTVSPTYLPKYDPTFWEGYSIMEPNAAIKKFTADEAK